MAREVANFDSANRVPSGETVIANRIFVGGIPNNADDNEVKKFLLNVFDKNRIKDVKIISDRTGTSKGYGFVTFESKELAQEVLDSAKRESIVYMDRKLNICKAVKKASSSHKTGNGSNSNPNASLQYVLYPGHDYGSYSHQMVAIPQYRQYPNTQLQLPLFVQSHTPYAYAMPAPVSNTQCLSAPTLLSQTAVPAMPWAGAVPVLPNQHLTYLNSSMPYFTAASSNSEGLNVSQSSGYNVSSVSDYYSGSGAHSPTFTETSEDSPNRMKQTDPCSVSVPPFSSGALPTYPYSQIKGQQAMQYAAQRMMLAAGGNY